MRKSYRTQWSGQFAAAFELTRRGYLVSIPLGNAPILDLLCQSPNGQSFPVQIKSLGSKGFFPFQNNLIKTNHPDIYFIFVYIPDKLEKPLEFFVMSKKEFEEACKKEKEEAKKKEEQRGTPYKEFSTGLSYKTLLSFDYKNKWNVLPK